MEPSGEFYNFGFSQYFIRSLSETNNVLVFATTRVYILFANTFLYGHALLSGSKLYLVGILFETFFEFPNGFFERKQHKICQKKPSETAKIFVVDNFRIF